MIYLHRSTIPRITNRLLQNYLTYMYSVSYERRFSSSDINLFPCMHGFLLKRLYWACFNFNFIYVFEVKGSQGTKEDRKLGNLT